MLQVLAEGYLGEKTNNNNPDNNVPKPPTMHKIYCDESWSRAHEDYDPEPTVFTGPTPGFTNGFYELPSGIPYFNDIWG